MVLPSTWAKMNMKTITNAQDLFLLIISVSYLKSVAQLEHNRLKYSNVADTRQDITKHCSSLFVKKDGIHRISRITDEFCLHILSHPILATYWRFTNMGIKNKRQRISQQRHYKLRIYDQIDYRCNMERSFRSGFIVKVE